jgi:hypothetical protein
MRGGSLGDIIRIGIDPGSDTGIAVWNTEKKSILALVTIKSPLAAEMAVTLAQVHSAGEVLIEKPGPAIYRRPGQSQLSMLKIARNVGQCQELAEEIFRALVKAGFNARTVPPMKGGTKWNAALFGREFSYKGKSSSHSRDAAVIARYSL